MLATTLRADDSDSQSERNPGHNKKSIGFELTVRKDNGVYGTAVYSFRFSTQDVQTHRNLADLVYNGCEQLRVNVHGGLKSRIADLVLVDFNQQYHPPVRGWKQHCVCPTKSHIYVQEINDGQHKAYGKFPGPADAADRHARSEMGAAGAPRKVA